MRVKQGVQYHQRLADAYLRELFGEFAAVMVTGGRAAGKTTTAANVAQQIDRLDLPGVSGSYRADPDATLRRATRPVLIDEWQEVPEVLGAVKRAVDADPTPGQFLLTGSVRADLMHETWAGTGRVVRMNMYGVTERERHEELDPDQLGFLTRVATTGIDDLRVPASPPDIDAYIRLALRGSFPELAYQDRSERATGAWLTSYIDDLVTRDAVLVDQRKDPGKLRRYLAALALNNAGMPSDATLHRAAEVDTKTVAGYHRLLSDLFVLDTVPAWSSNRLSRMVKAPKRYIVDTGLAASAAGLTFATVIGDDDLRGRFFDGFATAQLRPEIALTYPRPTMYHLRMEGGRREVDLVVDMGASRVVGIEFKAGAAPGPRDARHLVWLRDEMGDDFLAGVVLHSGPSIFELDDRVWAIPVCAIWS